MEAINNGLVALRPARSVCIVEARTLKLHHEYRHFIRQ